MFAPVDRDITSFGTAEKVAAPHEGVRNSRI